MAQHYDIVVLGGGIGGYSAAIRASQLGKKTAIVERDKIGGTCLHRGCIPSKALLRSAELFAQMKRGDEFGIAASDVALRFDLVQSRKQKVVDQLYQGLQMLMRKNKIDIVAGNGRIVGPSIFSPRSGAVAVERADGETETLVPEHLIVATGSRPKQLPGLEADGVHVLTSDDALRLEQLPASIVIIGGGVIGVEWASMLADFGVEVTVVEYAPRLLPQEDEDISKELERQLVKRGVHVYTGAKVIANEAAVGEGVRVPIDRAGERLELQAEKALVAVGREANIDGIGLENTDIRVEKGFIKVNARYQTAEAHIYAVGDAIGGLQLAHAAAHEGIAAAEQIAGLAPETAAPHLVPRCVYSHPETASVGWTEKEAASQGHDVKVGKFPFAGVGKALVYGDADGFVKVVADRTTGDILGVHMIGARVTDLISEAALAQLLDATPWEVGKTIHPHPTMSEALAEAMLVVDGRALGM